ncbi:MAG: hypothetical protein JOS17DRAFT_240666 [Linnemannia elongata]|nr:MAG: hypothetical protein JOS17DRAFT_240666 [Linnemannia elongata]
MRPHSLFSLDLIGPRTQARIFLRLVLSNHPPVFTPLASSHYFSYSSSKGILLVVVHVLLMEVLLEMYWFSVPFALLLPSCIGGLVLSFFSMFSCFVRLFVYSSVRSLCFELAQPVSSSNNREQHLVGSGQRKTSRFQFPRL